jgi:hypothetical protein
MRYAIDQRPGDSGLSVAERMRVELPRRFCIYTRCCNEEFGIDAIGEAPHGTWTTTSVILSGDIDTFYYFETKAKRRARRTWLDSTTT